ncbi:hypothetical protein [Clostridium beijerinckii]|uniref:Uncharacterized protein n=1 Tax=Clostridium beijerinckii TaxID=1520 RepID=A0A1S8S761_CLOBE|nr:hypothetical protein [Clostridium beijerinckii]NRY61480.1 transcriptional regulator with XRE-family HTH domain [Clostridium beijerinckii]OOM61267.1 hypothetical protein CLBCK_24010 [Clostridium beijerinckii]
MDNKDVFNKESFALLLEKAKGNRSINQYANETRVSAAHISRFLREMIDAPPTPETISKLAAEAYNEVTYQDLMIAAGHLAEQYNDDDMEAREDSVGQEKASIIKDSPINHRNEIIFLEKKFIQIILADLYNKSFAWSIEKSEKLRNGGRGFYMPDMTVNIDYDGYKKWYFEFKAISNDRNFMSTMLFQHLYGTIAMSELLPTDKFTIVVNSEKAYEALLNRPPVSLRANLYIMLINLDKGEVIKEEQLCKY